MPEQPAASDSWPEIKALLRVLRARIPRGERTVVNVGLAAVVRRAVEAASLPLEEEAAPSVSPEGAPRAAVPPQAEGGCDGSPGKSLTDLISAVETREVSQALLLAEGNKTKAADRLGISRFTLQRILDRLAPADVCLPSKADVGDSAPHDALAADVPYDTGVIGHASPVAPGTRPLRVLVAEATAGVERQAILDALEKCQGQKSRAARLLGVSRPTLDSKLQSYGMEVRPRRDLGL